MARMFTDGAEMGDVLFFSGYSGITASTTQKASGAYSYAGTQNHSGFKTFAEMTEIYTKQRIRTTVNQDAGARIVAFRNSTTELAGIGLDNVRRWFAVVGSTTVETATETASLSTWYCVEVYFKHDNVAGRIVVKIDGNTVIDYTGDTKIASETGFDNVYWFYGGGATAFAYLDDIAANDVTGGADDSWVGPGRITKITPNGNGATTEWTGSDADDTDNYLMVDEYPSDGDTTYVYELASATGDLDQYTMTDDYDGTDRAVTRIWAECRARKTSAAAATLKIGFDTGASVNTDDVGALYETYTVKVVGADYKLNPDDAAAWEEADIDALEFVAEVG